jgi:hypothetical protein
MMPSIFAKNFAIASKIIKKMIEMYSHEAHKFFTKCYQNMQNIKKTIKNLTDKFITNCETIKSV